MAVSSNPVSARRFAGRRPAVGLIEVSICAIIVSVMLVTALDTMAMATRTHLIQSELDVALELAQDLMAEILQAHYEEPEASGTTTILRNGITIALASSVPAAAVSFGLEQDEPDTSRAQFDDVDDYSGWSENPPQTKDGVVMTEHAGFTRRVTVTWVEPDDPSVVSTTDAGLKRITVQVQNPRGGGPTLVLLRGRNGVLDRLPSVEATYVRNVSIELQLGTAGRRLTTAAAVVNQVPLGENP